RLNSRPVSWQLGLPMGATSGLTDRHVTRFTRFCAALTIAIGALVLAGWAFDVGSLKSIFPGLVTMKANTAACLVLTGLSLLGLEQEAFGARAAGLALSAFVMAVGVVTLSQDIYGWNAAIDQLLVQEPAGSSGTVHPGRMSPATAILFVLLGAAVAMLFWKAEIAVNVSQLLAAAAETVSAIALGGYAVGQSELYAVPAYSSMALHTAFAFAVLGLGVLSTRAKSGWMRELTAGTSSAMLTRRLALTLLILLPALAWLRLEAQTYGWYGARFGVVLHGVLGAALFAFALWFGTRAANRLEAREARLQRTYLVLSSINALIVRSHDRQSLVKESCQIAVEAGRYPLAWIGLVDRERARIRPVAWAGEVRGFLEQAADRLSLRDDAQGFAAKAILERRPMIVNDVSTAENMPSRAALLDRGARSFAMFPLIAGDEPLGVLALHSGEAHFFDSHETRLLAELAGDIAFAMDHLAKEERLNYLAYYNTLTKLANRSLFNDRLVQHVSGAERAGGGLALILIDVEGFARINTAFGRYAGDRIITEIGSRLERCVEDVSWLARIDADRFALIVPRAAEPAVATRAYESVAGRCFDRPFTVGGQQVRLAVRAGIALYPQDGGDAGALLQSADWALAQAKRLGERYELHGPEATSWVKERLQLETEVRRAVGNGELLLHYQPKVELRTRALAGFEALMRWHSPGRGLVSPASFIPIMEDTGVIVEAGAW